MPGSKYYRHDDNSAYDHDYDQDRDYSRGRDRVRPRPHHRSSSYDDRYEYRRPQSTRRRYDAYSDNDDDDDDDYHYGRQSSRPKRWHTKSAGPSRRRERSESRDWYEQMAREKKSQAIRSALTAGAMEAVRQRNRPGDWLGERGLRVATAAMSAAAIDTVVDRHPRKRSKTKLVTSALGGLVVDKLARGVGGRH